MIANATLALSCALFLASMRSGITKAKVNLWLDALKNDKLTCAPQRFGDDHRPWPPDQKNENGCAHQFGASCLFNVNDRRSRTHLS